MEYYRLRQSKDVINPIRINELDASLYTTGMSHQDFRKLEEVIVSHIIYDSMMEMPDIIKSPTYMVSDEIRKVLHLYDENISFKAVQLFPYDIEQVSEASKTYWVYDCVMEDCMHRETVIAPNGEIKDLILDKHRVRGREIFRVKGVLMNELVISLAVAESIARRNMYGIDLERIVMK